MPSARACSFCVNMRSDSARTDCTRELPATEYSLCSKARCSFSSAARCVGLAMGLRCTGVCDCELDSPAMLRICVLINTHSHLFSPVRRFEPDSLRRLREFDVDVLGSGESSWRTNVGPLMRSRTGVVERLLLPPRYLQVID